MSLSRYSAWIGIGVGIVGLAIAGFAHADSTLGGLKLEASLPADQVELLRSDREVFSTFSIHEGDTALKDLLGVSSLSAPQLNAWLEARVQAVVGEDYKPNDHLVVLKKGFAFDEPGIYPNVEVSHITPVKGIIVMSNVGEYVYQLGKHQSALLGMQIDGVGVIPMTSPRSGVIQVGPGLFSSNHPIDPSNPKGAANAIPRLGTFFHESRHSDGHGKTLGFLHAVCPEGHEMQGWNACDRNSNGPYTVGARMIQAMTEACTQCTTGQREALRLKYLDSYGRALPFNLDASTVAGAWDSAPEGRR